jgi:hypothetical protein
VNEEEEGVGEYLRILRGCCVCVLCGTYLAFDVGVALEGDWFEGHSSCFTAAREGCLSLSLCVCVCVCG